MSGAFAQFGLSLTVPYASVRIFTPPRGPVAQLGARINRTDEVAGSNPARSTGVQPGPIAQLGARLNGIEKVVGSNPTGSTHNLATGQYGSSKPSSSEPGMVEAWQARAERIG